MNTLAILSQKDCSLRIIGLFHSPPAQARFFLSDCLNNFMEAIYAPVRLKHCSSVVFVSLNKTITQHHPDNISNGS